MKIGMHKAKKAGKQIAPSEARQILNCQQAADHIASVTLELSAIAEKLNLPFLKYLLDMTADEAMSQSDMPRRRRTDKP